MREKAPGERTNTPYACYPQNGSFINKTRDYIIYVIIILILLSRPLSAYQSEQYQYLQERMKEKTKLERVLKTEKYYDKNINKYVDVVAGEILVKYKPSISAQSIEMLNKRNKVNIIRKLPNNIHLLSISTQEAIVSVEQLIEAYKRDPSVEYAEPNYISHLLTTTPNDTYYNLQHGLPQIKANLGWDYNKGSSNVVIAVIDSGIDANHPDLINKVWKNPIESVGSKWNNGIDDDGNGYIDDWCGWDFYWVDNSPLDANGHGTHVSGIAAADTNNSIGVAGVAWNSKIMALRASSQSGSLPSDAVISAIYYAANNGAKVINMSLGSSSSSSPYNSAIQYAHSKGCVIVASAGNDWDSTINYPASYTNVISVASVDKNDSRAYYSNYNAYVDVCAPGGVETILHDPNAILSTLPTYSVYVNIDGYNNNYDYFQGTSMAAPFVSGLAALLFSQYPSWTNTQVENRIVNLADDLGTTGRDNYYGYGRINVYRALYRPPTPTINTITSPTIITSPIIAGTKSSDTTEILINGSSSGVTYPTTTTWSYTATLTSGTNTFTVKARDAAGNESDEASISLVLEDLSFSDSNTNTSIRFPIGCSTQIPVVTAAIYNNPETLGSYPTAKHLIGSAVNFSCNIGTFSSPIYVTMNMPSGTVNPLPYYWDSVFNTWSNSGLTFVSKTNTSITFTTTHLSIFGIFDVAGGMSNILIYPNPFQIGSSSGVLFDALSGNETIRIYTISGELTRSHQVQYEQSWVWDTKNNSGRQCAMGVYLYLITYSSGQKRIGKIGLTK